MSVMYMLITLSLLIAAGFLISFIVAIKNGQYDDKYTPSVRMLFDDELLNKSKKASSKNTTKQNQKP